MNFANKRLSEALDSLPKEIDSGAAKNKRRAGRVTVQSRLSIVRMHDGTACAPEVVELRDISPRGVRLIAKNTMAMGTQFALQMPAKTGAAPPSALICMVVHCKPEDGDRYSIGAEFTGQALKRRPDAADDEQRRRIQKSMFA